MGESNRRLRIDDERSSPPITKPIVESIDSTPPLNTTDVEFEEVDVTSPLNRAVRLVRVDHTEDPNPDTLGTHVDHTATVEALTEDIPVNSTT
jgi:hypothetical protein